MKAGCAILALIVAPIAHAQFITPNTTLPSLPRSALGVELELSRFRVDSFSRERIESQVPGKLDIDTGVLRLRFAFTRRIAAGVELPLRSVTYATDVAGTLRRSGAPGFGIFADWMHHPWRTDSTLRIEYARATRENDPVLAISDGIDRYALLYAVAKRGASFTGDVRLHATYGPGRFPDERNLAAAGLHVAFGRAIARRIDALAIAEISATSLNKQEGTYFDDRTGYRVDGGLMLRFKGRFSVAASVLFGRAPKYGVGGTRLTVSVCKVIGTRFAQVQTTRPLAK